MKYYISPPPMNPLSRLLTSLVAVLSLVGFVFFGLIVAGIVLAALFVFGLVFWLRVRWFGRNPSSNATPQGAAASDGQVIEAEYTVINQRHE